MNFEVHSPFALEMSFALVLIYTNASKPTLSKYDCHALASYPDLDPDVGS